MRRVVGSTVDGGRQLLTKIAACRNECRDILKAGSEVDNARPKRRRAFRVRLTPADHATCAGWQGIGIDRELTNTSKLPGRPARSAPRSRHRACLLGRPERLMWAPTRSRGAQCDRRSPPRPPIRRTDGLGPGPLRVFRREGQPLGLTPNRRGLQPDAVAVLREARQDPGTGRAAGRHELGARDRALRSTAIGGNELPASPPTTASSSGWASSPATLATRSNGPRPSHLRPAVCRPSRSARSWPSSRTPLLVVATGRSFSSSS